jgi:hypothetical protein
LPAAAKKPWKPRASAIGGYLTCLWRAANDRAVHEGRVAFADVGEKGEDTGYAPHGTCIHWVSQTGAGCEFPGKDDPDADALAQAREQFGGDEAAARAAFARGDPKAYAPSAAEWALASTLAPGGDPAIHRQMVVQVSQVLVSDLTKPPDGKPWIAESAWETDYCTGHIDLLSQDFDELGDIKTTAKPPDVAKVVCKPGYLAQMTLYERMVWQVTGVRPRRGFIHYIDSLKGNWTYRVPIDFTRDASKFYSDQLEAFCRFLMSDQLWAAAYPNLGEHCDQTWCPYRPTCKSAIMPPPGKWYDRARAMRPSGVINVRSIVR